MATSVDPPADVARLAKALADARPARSGSLVERFVKCSRPGCPCNDMAEARHGPYFSLTLAVDGRTHTRLIPDSQAELVREQIGAGRQFRERAQALRVAMERWACSSCESGFFPRDRAPGLERTHLTPGVTRMVAAVGASVSFEEGSSLLRELAGLDVDEKHVERAAETLGAEISEDERTHLAPLDDAPPPPTLYLGMDGTGVPMCPSELKGRAGKQADGSAKTREASLMTTPGSASSTSCATVTACATPSFARPAHASPPATSRPAASPPSLPASSALACTGPSAAPTALALRCCRLSGRVEDSWERRSLRHAA